MIKKASWIVCDNSEKITCPIYQKCFSLKGNIKKAFMFVTARGVYDACLNGKRISYVLAPGWTVYDKRHQYQKYDITDLLQENNQLLITVANGWYQFEKNDWIAPLYFERKSGALIGVIELTYCNGEVEYIMTDNTWCAGQSKLLYSDIYNGEIYDATKEIVYGTVKTVDYPKNMLVLQDGEIICEHEHFKPLSYIVTPKGERVLDFGQNMAGYVEFTVSAKFGDKVKISHAETLDGDGNFYTENYRQAKASIEYICTNGNQTYKPSCNFYGFRYIRLDEYPGDINPEDFTAIAVYSNLRQTGWLNSGNEMLNQLFSNVLWGQKSNYLDIPTDCPQRDEKLGWTGDAQVFIRTACYNYYVKRFFSKWLADLRAEQFENGMVTQTVPDVLKIDYTSTAWGDASVICPWNLYLMYGDVDILEKSYPSMKKWIDYIQEVSKEEYLWVGGTHHGDHLCIDGANGDWDSKCYGTSNNDLIASAIYAYSVSLFVKAGKVLAKDMSQYEELYHNIVSTFRKRFPVFNTQSEYALAVAFGLTENPQNAVDALADLIHKNDDALTTGFVGTPWLLYVLSKYGYAELAYTLLLREKYPSWFFSINMGATTIWEHWDGIREDGSMWDSAMNSFNHYSLGAVLEWVYQFAAGIRPVEEYPGFERLIVAPHPDKRLGHLEARFDTSYGMVRSYWGYRQDSTVRYEISIPTQGEIIIDGRSVTYPPGDYVFYSKIKENMAGKK